MNMFQRLRGLSPIAQVILVGGVAIVLAAALIGSYLALRPRYEVAFQNLRPADAATIVAQLDKDKTPYRLSNGGSTISAPANRVDEIRLGIMGADLPLKGTVGFELFNKSDMGLTEFAQRINYQRALQGELARTIMTMEAVDTARVHLTLPEPAVFRADRKPAKASVVLAPRVGRNLTPDAVSDVRRLVAAAVPDLEAQAVVIVDGTEAPIMGDVQAVGPMTGTSIITPIQAQSRAITAYYSAALRRVLEPLYPEVRVSVVAPDDQWETGHDSRAEREAALSSWTPQGRSFPLRIAINTPSGLSTLQQADVARLVTSAVDWSQTRGDVLAFPPWNSLLDTDDVTRRAEDTQSVIDVSSSAVRLDEDAAEPLPNMSRTAATVVSIVIGILFLAGLGLFWRRGRRKRLSPSERDTYVRRLQRLLDAEPSRG